MHSATIPLAALVTFAAVYWVAPAPARVDEAEAQPVIEAAAPASGDVELPRPVALPRARASRPRSHPARARRSSLASSDAADDGVALPARRAPQSQVYFSGCNEVRAAGLAPLYRGEPGYRSEMDGDDDGIACEPYRGHRPRG